MANGKKISVKLHIDTSEAEALLLEVLEMDINHSGAADLLDQVRMQWDKASAG